MAPKSGSQADHPEFELYRSKITDPAAHASYCYFVDEGWAPWVSYQFAAGYSPKSGNETKVARIALDRVKTLMERQEKSLDDTWEEDDWTQGILGFINDLKPLVYTKEDLEKEGN